MTHLGGPCVNTVHGLVDNWGEADWGVELVCLRRIHSQLYYLKVWHGKLKLHIKPCWYMYMYQQGFIWNFPAGRGDFTGLEWWTRGVWGHAHREFWGKVPHKPLSIAVAHSAVQLSYQDSFTMCIIILHIPGQGCYSTGHENVARCLVAIMALAPHSTASIVSMAPASC